LRDAWRRAEGCREEVFVQLTDFGRLRHERFVTGFDMVGHQLHGLIWAFIVASFSMYALFASSLRNGNRFHFLLNDSHIGHGENLNVKSREYSL
jgi:hypothetical protein